MANGAEMCRPIVPYGVGLWRCPTVSYYSAVLFRPIVMYSVGLLFRSVSAYITVWCRPRVPYCLVLYCVGL